MVVADLRHEGNKALQEGRPQEAISKYSEALKQEETAVLFANRAAAYAKIGRHELAAGDAKRSRELDPTYKKAWYREAKARMENFEIEGAEAVVRESGFDFDALLAAIAARGAKALAEPSIRHFAVMDELGTGNYSSIVMARRKVDGKVFAIKMIEKTEVEKIKKRHPNVENECVMEKRALLKLRHPNIVHLYATFQDYYALYYQMELCEEGEVWARLIAGEKQVPTYPSLARHWLNELVGATSYIHSMGMVHRDLKPENMMLKRGHLKLIDFGTAKDTVDTNLNGPEFVGTPEYMAPEMVDSKAADHRADWWAIGVVCFQLYTGTTPFRSRSPYFAFLKIRRGRARMPAALALDPLAADFVRRCVQVDPNNRFNPKGHALLGPFAQIPPLKELCVRYLRSGRELNALTKARATQFLLRTGELDLLRHFYYSPVDAKLLRADPYTRTYIGHTQEEQGLFERPFQFAIIVDPKGDHVVSAVNALRPAFVLVFGDADRTEMARIAVPTVFSRGTLDPETYEKNFGSKYYAFWCKGARFVVVDDLEDDEQRAFVDEELEINALGSHRVFFVSKRSPVSKPLDENDCDKKARWLFKLLKGRVDAWLCAAPARRKTQTFHPTDLDGFDVSSKKSKPPRTTFEKKKNDPSSPSSSSSSSEEEEDADPLKDATKFSVIATSSAQGAIADDERVPPGLALVSVYEGTFSYHFYDLDKLPLP
ncbi:hypothetical protein CTAYLR_009506 [Chrysophaeum taylorii]|uniref:Protein kinase domain-containing protein n=1 Tax=Chrysophaeum taylorii TaxID=2483200 RepID=A0AAD7U6T7_9STRA|nr:hypothetical protein CTAYLR_009506 [Chrysophaeum taylorii]